jgi:chemotaxis protein methyltransferase CheR
VNPITADPSLSDVAFQQFHELILARTGLDFRHHRRRVLTQALVQNAQAEKCQDLNEYFLLLSAEPTNSSRWNELIKSLTVGETYFFRDSDQIQVMREHILPDLIARRWVDHTLRVWSAGCSTGEEAYTLAILLREVVPDVDHWRITILATDINRAALQKAETAVYREWSFRQAAQTLKAVYFTQKGENFELIPQIRQMVSFCNHNLADPSFQAPNGAADLDLILCRNVALYLSPEAMRSIVLTFHRALSPGGWLVVGSSETDDDIFQSFHPLRFKNATVYQRLGQHPSMADPNVQAAPAMADSAGPIFADDAAQPPIIVFPAAERQLPQPSIVDPFRRSIVHSPGPGRDIPNLIETGKDHLNSGRYSEARKCFSTCLEIIPEHATALYYLASIEANAGRLEEAQRCAEQSLAHDPIRSEAHYLLALILLERGQPTTAMDHFNKAVYLNPEFILAHFNLANLYRKGGQTENAARHRANAIRLASRLSPEDILPGSDELTAEQFLRIIGDA